MKHKHAATWQVRGADRLTYCAVVMYDFTGLVCSQPLQLKLVVSISV